MTALVEEKLRYTVTAAAGELVAGRPHGGVGSTVELTATEARYELLLGAIVPDGVTVVVPPPIGPVAPIDRIVATRGSKEWDFTVADLAEYLAASDLGGALRDALRDGVPPERDTLAKLSAALDAAVALLRTAIQARAPGAVVTDLTILSRRLTVQELIDAGGAPRRRGGGDRRRRFR